MLHQKHYQEGWVQRGSCAELPIAPKKKKPKTKPIQLVLEEPVEEPAQGPAQEEMPSVPPTPVRVIQAIGADLQIDPSLLSKEKLMETSSADATSSNDANV